MDQQIDLSALNGQHLDPEVFRRVWNRVMPNQEDSPILVNQPPAPPPAPAPPPPTAQGEAGGGGCTRTPPQAKRLSELMDLAWEGASALQLLSRRMGNARTLSGLLADWRKILRQLSTAYFLTTGEHYQPKRPASGVNANVALALRERFYWEEKWARACLERAEQAQELTLRELYQELAQSGLLHAKIIRSMLERM